MRVVFMGTPDIAATCLTKILEDGFDVVGVYTQPDRPKGRGMKMVYSPVKKWRWPTKFRYFSRKISVAMTL